MLTWQTLPLCLQWLRGLWQSFLLHNQYGVIRSLYDKSWSLVAPQVYNSAQLQRARTGTHSDGRKNTCLHVHKHTPTATCSPLRCISTSLTATHSYSCSPTQPACTVSLCPLHYRLSVPEGYTTRHMYLHGTASLCYFKKAEVKCGRLSAAFEPLMHWLF